MIKIIQDNVQDDKHLGCFDWLGASLQSADVPRASFYGTFISLLKCHFPVKSTLNGTLCAWD